ncbi:MAG TPA: flavin reductase, partial [Paraburkholderia sp.]
GDHPDLRTCHYVAGGTFFATGDAFEVAPASAASAD